MKTKDYQFLILIIMAIFLSMNVFSQPGTLTLTFAGDNNSQPATLESVVVKNLTQSCDTTLYPPDFTLVIDTIQTGISILANSENNFTVSQNYPNPFTDQTTISIYLPKKDNIEIWVSNLLGQQLARYSGQLSAGTNTFQFFPSSERIYIVLVRYKGVNRSIQMLSAEIGIYKKCSLKYNGNEGFTSFKSVQSKNYFDFHPGDQLLFIGKSLGEESGLLESPTTNQDYIIQFATNIPCIGIPTVDYEGQIYNTIQIFSQCWLKENLNAGIMIPSTQGQTNNSTIEKYCMVDEESNCDILGGLYFWNEMMKYSNETEGQGICPEGWHIPCDMDWQILEGAVDSDYEIGDPVWGINNWRGTDAGGNLKQSGTDLWVYPNTGATNAFGFSALPGGYFVQNEFWGPGYKTYLWSSEYPQKFYRNMDWDQSMIQRNPLAGSAAFSVRCIKN